MSELDAVHLAARFFALGLVYESGKTSKSRFWRVVGTLSGWYVLLWLAWMLWRYYK